MFPCVIANYAARRVPPDGYAGVAALDRDLEPETEPCLGCSVTVTSPPIRRAYLRRDGQPQAGSLLECYRNLSGLAEWLEQLLLILIRNSRARIFNQGRQPELIGLLFVPR